VHRELVRTASPAEKLALAEILEELVKELRAEGGLAAGATSLQMS
jgi:hypothetical protein